MMKRKLRKGIVLLICVVLFCGSTVWAADEQVKLSNVEYAVSLNEAVEVFIGNKEPVSGVVGSKVFLTYTVEKITKNAATNDGVVAATTNKGKYPYANGGMRYWASGSKLFEEGWTYVYRFERTTEGFEYTVAKMKGDIVRTIKFTKPEGSPDGQFQYFGIWTGGAKDHIVSGVLSHVRCYDENGNDLGISASKSGMVTAKTSGEPADYAEVAEGYYCKANDTAIVLTKEKVAHKLTKDVAEEVPYSIYYDTQLTLAYKDGKEIYERDFFKLVDEDGNEYERLKPVKVTFVTGEETFVQQANVDSRYRIEKPEAPTKKGNTFKGWYLGNDVEYEFGNTVTESMVLYAKWQDADGNEYLATEAEVDYSPYIAIGVSVLILAGCAVACVIIVKQRRRQHEKAD